MIRKKRNKNITIANTELPKGFLEMSTEEQLDFCGKLLGSMSPSLETPKDKIPE